MDIRNVLTRVIRLPSTFKEQDTASMRSLLRESGYFEAHASISEADIRQALLEQPGCIEAWLHYSEDKRGGGWYLRASGSGYELGHVPPRGDDRGPVEYSDGATACAAFIKRELDEVRSGS